MTDGPDKSNYLSIILLIVLVTDAFSRVVYKRRMLVVGTFVLTFGLIATFLSIYFESMRNGTIAVTLVMVVMLALLLKRRIIRSVSRWWPCLQSVVISSFVYISVRADHKWDTIGQTLPIALDTQQNKAWLNLSKYPIPKMLNGEPVEQSAYLRIAWLKEGILLVMEHPFGLGFGRNAFGHGIKNKYGEESQTAHSHSGLLDIAIGTGLPGLILWIGFLFYLMLASFRQFKMHKSYTALLLFLMVMSFSWRMSVDSIIRDHMSAIHVSYRAFVSVHAERG